MDLDHLDHRPGHPDWDCLACGKPWPCDPARERLAAEFVSRPTALRMYMWGHLEDAAGALAEVPAGELFDRFLRWAR